MSAPHPSESVRAALRRARWLHWALVFLILMLALGTLRNGAKLQALRRRDDEARRVLLLEEVRKERNTGAEGWLSRARLALDDARHILADRAIRDEWTACLAKAADARSEQPLPFRALVVPPAQRRALGPPITLDFTGDGSRLVAGVDGRTVNWLLRDPLSPPRIFNGNRDRDPVLSESLCPTTRLRARAGEHGVAELLSEAGVLIMTLEAPQQRRATNVAWSDNGEWLAIAGTTPAPTGPLLRTVELWHLPSLRAGLAELDLNWDDAAPGAPPLTPPDPARWARATRVSLGALLVFLVGAAAIANQHLVFRRYEQAERTAAERTAELEQIRERMAHADKMRALGTLAAGVAHDFNNLLSVIQMSRQLVERSVKPAGPTKEQLDNIGHAVEQGRAVVRSILGYSRDTLVMTRRVRMGTLIEETLNLLRGQFLGGVELTTTFDPDLPAVEVSQGRLEQVLLNFVVNAAEAMNGRGRLELRAALTTAATGCVKPPTGAGPWVELTVADSGPGIPAEVLPRIFEPFYTTKNLGNQRGTGLGLATVWRLAEEEQFGLRVRTEPGRGTEFSVLVPVQKPTPSA